MAVDRGCYIDQSQSLSIHMDQPNFGKLTSLHFHTWSKGLKTGMYYLRSRAAADTVELWCFGLLIMLFSDGSTEVELRLALGDGDLISREVSVDANENSLVVKISCFGLVQTLIDTNALKPGETIWYIDEDQLVINLKKQDPELKWPDIVESWESLSSGLVQLMKGTSIFLVGESTEINEKIARELAVGLGYTPPSTRELLEAVAKQPIESCIKMALSSAGKHTNGRDVRIYENSDELSTELAEYIAEVSEAAVKDRGIFVVAISGGSLISSMRKLCKTPYSKTVDWAKWYIF